ncbi:hypothetical protein [Gymnodinialimonas ulvae]|uniref:hypothetical protein n=1 Tax=Gymnodinialimonas ulvae TaxID=3126504 RepID=UPI003098A003
MRRLSLACLTAILCTLPVAAAAQDDTAPVALTCLLNVLCPHTGACRDLGQTIEITEGDAGWRVDWVGTDLPSNYELIADIPPAADAVEQTRLRSLIHRDTNTQSTQMISFDTAGHVVVTTHQPQAGMQVVTGLGTCEAAG